MRWRSLSLLLAILSVTAGCSQPFDPPIFNYLACRQSKTLELKQQGVEAVAANMQAMAYCKQQQAMRLR